MLIIALSGSAAASFANSLLLLDISIILIPCKYNYIMDIPSFSFELPSLTSLNSDLEQNKKDSVELPTEE